MTDDRSPMLVAIALVAAIFYVLGTLMVWSRTARGADDPGSFWRESLQQVAERAPRGRARLMKRKRYAPADSHRAQSKTIRMVGVRSAFDRAMVMAQRPPAIETPAAFVDRAVLPPAPVGMDLPPFLPTKFYPLPPLPRPEEKPRRNDGDRRLACVAIVVVAAIGGALLSLKISERGIVHVT